MEKNEIKSALEVALELKNELLAMYERSNELIRELDRLLQSDGTRPTLTGTSMPECLKRVPPTYKYRVQELCQLLNKAQKAGVLDEDLQPLCSWQEACVLANLICDQLKITRKWRVFMYIWDVRGSKLSSGYQQALKSADFVDIEKRINKILSTPE